MSEKETTMEKLGKAFSQYDDPEFSKKLSGKGLKEPISTMCDSCKLGDHSSHELGKCINVAEHRDRCTCKES